MLDFDGEILLRTQRPPVHIIEGDDYFDVSGTYAIRISADTYEKCIDTIISSAYVSTPGQGEIAPDFNIQDWKLGTDGVHVGMAATDTRLDGMLLDDVLSDCMEVSKFVMAIGSTTANKGGCELLLADLGNSSADIAEAWNEIGSTTTGGPKGVTADMLSKIWTISYEMAVNTISLTSQLNLEGENTSLARNLGTNERILRYRRIKSHFLTDTLFVTKEAKSTRGHTCMQIFVSEKGFVKVYPMNHQRDYLVSLRHFAKDVGAPDIIVCDPHPSQKSFEVKDFCNKIGTTLKLLEQGTQWANRSGISVGLVKEAVRKDIRLSHSPLVLWDYAAELRADIMSLTERDLFQLQGSNPHTATFGEEEDISHLFQFAWYEWVYFYDDSSAARFPFIKATLGRVLGPSKNKGNDMTKWCLKSNGNFIPRRTVKRITAEQLVPSNDVEIKKRTDFDNNISRKLADSFSLPENRK